ncbi:HNH endonuclease signature motif containing protein [Heyndrickxia coagulans]|uniref:HNH endonuclease n=1 Tax=Heyndrickxia coagulans TaxID=1398 RepID=UPI003D1B1BD7
MASVRGKITKEQYNQALQKHGAFCFVCGTTENLEAHHVRFKSAGGRGQWRNIRFLCAEHHRGKYSPHQNEQLRKELEKLHEKLYGPWFWADKYDLFKAGLIPNTTDEEFEKFMKGEEKS